jgi:ATP-independent RNA helicase DbpA
MPYKPQVHSLSPQAHIIVGTPGRILKHLEEESFNTQDIDTLVLDEADRMLDMGFNEDIMEIIEYLPKQRQTLLFSATYPDDIDKLSHNIMNNPITIQIDTTHEKEMIEQKFYSANGMGEKKDNILKVLNKRIPNSAVIFCNTKIACDELADELENFGLDVLVLHSDLDQKDRSECLILFSNKSYPILIATDVAARGLDIDDLDLVVNYDLPYDLEVYTHRIGRTARAGKSGCAISLVDGEQNDIFEDICDIQNENFTLESLENVTFDYDFKLLSPWRTIFINGGKKVKVRAGDILGALTADIGLDKNDVGKIDILQNCSYVAIKTNMLKKAYDGLRNGKIKGKYFRVYEK